GTGKFRQGTSRDIRIDAPLDGRIVEVFMHWPRSQRGRVAAGGGCCECRLRRLRQKNLPRQPECERLNNICGLVELRSQTGSWKQGCEPLVRGQSSREG